MCDVNLGLHHCRHTGLDVRNALILDHLGIDVSR